MALICALMPARNEAWVIGYSLRAVLQWCNHACVLLHRSGDATPESVAEIAAENPGRVTVLTEDREPWDEATYRQRLLEAGRATGATHFAAIDADEILTANWSVERGWLFPAELAGELPWIDLWRSLDVMRASRASQAIPCIFADRPDLFYRPDADGYQLHKRTPHHVDWARTLLLDPLSGGLMHLQRCSWRRAQARQAHYKMVELLRWPNHRGGVAEIDRRHSKSIAEPDDMTMVSVPDEWWAHGIDRNLIDLDAPPWEEREVLRLLNEHGRDRFAGLDLSGFDSPSGRVVDE